MKARPLGVSVIAVLNWSGGVVMLLGGLATFSLNPLTAIFSLVLGVFALWVGYGLWTLQGWAWQTAVILQTLAIVMDFTQVLAGLGIPWLGLLINGVVLFYLFSATVKETFQRA